MTASNDDPDVLLNRLADEFAGRRRAGERPRLEEYCDRYPDLADDIRSLFPAMLELERAKADAGAVLVVALDGRPITTLGDFRLLREVGRGGMGVVYEAEQVSLGRRVALKLLPPGVFRDPVKRRRFEREAKAAAKLHHTNIVPVHGFGEHDGTPYYVMQFIPGLGLDAVIHELAQAPGPEPARPRDPDRAGLSAALARSLLGHDTSATGPGPRAADLGATAADGDPPGPPPGPDRSSSGSFSASGVHLPGQSGVPSTSGKKTTYWESVARIGVQVAAALAYAHKLGVLHRDVKPANLLLDLDGIVWVTDFGLAKADDSDNLTHTGDVLGTLRYMPPEAFEGKSDARSDVYALGLTLFELIALRPAYEERDRHKLIKQVTGGDTPRLHRLRPDAPRDLVTVVEKATDKDPARRYPTAAALVEDLQRFLDDEPIRARRQTAAESVWRWARQNRSVAALAAVVFVLLSAIAAGSLAAAAYFRDLEREQRGLVRAKAALADRNERLAEENEAAKKKAVEAQTRAEITLVDMQTARGLLAADRSDPARALLWFAKAAADGNDDPVRQADNLRRARNWARELTLPVRAFPVRGGVRTLEFCPGKDLLLVLADDRLTVRDWRADADLRWASDVPKVGAAAWSPDGDWLAVGAHAGGVQIRGVPDGRVLQEFNLAGCVTALAITPDGNRVAVATAAGAVPWDVSGGVPAGLGESSVRLLDLKARAMVPGEWKHPAPVYAVTFNRAGTRLVTASLDKQARMFDPAKRAPLFAVPHAPRYASPPALVENDRRLVTVSVYSTTKPAELAVWDAANGQPAGAGTVRARPNYPTRVVAAPRGNWFAVSGHYGPEVWPAAEAGARSVYVEDHTGYVEDIVAGPDGKTLLSASWDQTARLWSVPDGKPLGSPLPHTGVVTRCAIAPDNLHLATLAEGLVRVWRRAAGAAPRISPAPAQGVARPSFDGRLVAGGTWHEWPVAPLPIAGGTVTVADAATGAAAGPAVPLPGRLVDSCVCADNRTAAAVSEVDGVGWLTLADVATGKPVADPVRLPASPRGVAARPTAPQVAVLCAGGELVVCDTRTGKEIYRDTPAEASVAWRSARVAYTADGATLVSLTSLDTIHVRDAATGRRRDRVIRPAAGGDGACRTFALSPDSRLLATGVNGKNAAQVWDLATGEPLSKPLAHPGDHYGLFCLCFSRDGRYLLTGSKNGQARLWDWSTGTPVGPSLMHDDEVFAVALTACGRFALTAGRDRASKLHVWELNTGRLVAPKIPLPNNVVSLTPSPDGASVLAGSLSGMARIDLDTLLSPADLAAADYQLFAELASGQRIEHGDETGLTREEWLDRLARFVPKFPGPSNSR